MAEYLWNEAMFMDSWFEERGHYPVHDDGGIFAHDWHEGPLPDNAETDFRCRRCVLAADATARHADQMQEYLDPRSPGNTLAPLSMLVAAAYWFAEHHGWITP